MLLQASKKHFLFYGEFIYSLTGIIERETMLVNESDLRRVMLLYLYMGKTGCKKSGGHQEYEGSITKVFTGKPFSTESQKSVQLLYDSFYTFAFFFWPLCPGCGTKDERREVLLIRHFALHMPTSLRRG